jgi:Protein of unknwon function (DUF3310)
MTNQINPDHYKFGGIETIDYLQAKMTPEEFEGFLKGNVLKYLSRAKHKGGLTDLQKAQWYLTRLIDTTSRAQGMKPTEDDEAKPLKFEVKNGPGRLSPTPP